MIPKFRAWDTYHETYIDDYPVYINNKEEVYWDHYEMGLTSFNYSVIIEQSTGLFDINGKEIFEGDIVKVRPTAHSIYLHAKIINIIGRGYRIATDNWSCELWLRNDGCEIIGNIHENPELLEVE